MRDANKHGDSSAPATALCSFNIVVFVCSLQALLKPLNDGLAHFRDIIILLTSSGRHIFTSTPVAAHNMQNLTKEKFPKDTSCQKIIRQRKLRG